MPSVWATVQFLLVSVNAVALGEMGGRNQLLFMIVQELKMSADIQPEPEHHIVSIQDHYTTALTDFQASIEEDRNGDIMMSDIACKSL